MTTTDPTTRGRALYLPAGNGDPRLITLDLHNPATIAKAIGCRWVERVRTPIENVALVVDEQGLHTDKSANHLASFNLYPGVIIGDALVVSEAWVQGEDGGGIDFTGLTDQHLWDVLTHLCIKPVVSL